MKRKKPRTVPFWIFAVNAGICLTLLGVNMLAIHTTTTALAVVVQNREEGWCEGYFLATEVSRQGRDDVRRKLGLGLSAIAGGSLADEHFSEKMAAMVIAMIDAYIVPPRSATFQDTDAGISFDCSNGDLVPAKPTRSTPQERREHHASR